MRKRGKDEGVMRSKNEGVMRMAVRFISVWSVCHIGMHAPLALPPSPSVSPAPPIAPTALARSTIALCCSNTFTTLHTRRWLCTAVMVRWVSTVVV